VCGGGDTDLLLSRSIHALLGCRLTSVELVPAVTYSRYRGWFDLPIKERTRDPWDVEN
jgi:hypothetical protein